MKILITGSNGMLGHDLIDVLQENHDLILTTSKTLDITDEKQVMERRSPSITNSLWQSVAC